MKTSDFYYDLPEELIAQDPLADRSSSRLMILDRKTGDIQHKIFKDIIDELNRRTVLSLMIQKSFRPDSTVSKKARGLISRFFF